MSLILNPALNSLQLAAQIMSKVANAEAGVCLITCFQYFVQSSRAPTPLSRPITCFHVTNLTNPGVTTLCVGGNGYGAPFAPEVVERLRALFLHAGRRTTLRLLSPPSN